MTSAEPLVQGAFLGYQLEVGNVRCYYGKFFFFRKGISRPLHQDDAHNHLLNQHLESNVYKAVQVKQQKGCPTIAQKQ